jgi:hypothetical protein
LFISLLLDVEDIVTPEADDITKQVADILTDESARGMGPSSPQVRFRSGHGYWQSAQHRSDIARSGRHPDPHDPRNERAMRGGR